MLTHAAKQPMLRQHQCWQKFRGLTQTFKKTDKYWHSTDIVESLQSPFWSSRQYTICVANRNRLCLRDSAHQVWNHWTVFCRAYSWSARQWKIGTKYLVRHGFCCRGSISNPRPVLDSSRKTTRGMLLGFSCKTSKRARLASCRVLVFSRGF